MRDYLKSSHCSKPEYGENWCKPNSKGPWKRGMTSGPARAAVCPAQAPSHCVTTSRRAELCHLCLAWASMWTFLSAGTPNRAQMAFLTLTRISTIQILLALLPVFPLEAFFVLGRVWLSESAVTRNSNQKQAQTGWRASLSPSGDVCCEAGRLSDQCTASWVRNWLSLTCGRNLFLQFRRVNWGHLSPPPDTERRSVNPLIECWKSKLRTKGSWGCHIHFLLWVCPQVLVWVAYVTVVNSFCFPKEERHHYIIRDFREASPRSFPWLIWYPVRYGSLWEFRDQEISFLWQVL